MKTAKKVYESDDEGVVHVDVPVGSPGKKVEVVVVWQELAEPTAEGAEGEGVADLIGLLEDVDDFQRPAQGTIEQRRPFG